MVPLQLSDALSKHRHRMTLPSFLLLLLLVHWPHLQTIWCKLHTALYQNSSNLAANLPEPDRLISSSAGNCAAIRRSCQQKNPDHDGIQKYKTASHDSKIMSVTRRKIKVSQDLEVCPVRSATFPMLRKRQSDYFE